MIVCHEETCAVWSASGTWPCDCHAAEALRELVEAAEEALPDVIRVEEKDVLDVALQPFREEVG